jgi:hypothetical protein
MVGGHEIYEDGMYEVRFAGVSFVKPRAGFYIDPEVDELFELLDAESPEDTPDEPAESGGDAKSETKQHPSRAARRRKSHAKQRARRGLRKQRRDRMVEMRKWT